MVRAARRVFGAWLVHSRAARRVAEIAARRSSVARLRSAATLLVGWRAAAEVGAGGDSFFRPRHVVDHEGDLGTGVMGPREVGGEILVAARPGKGDDRWPCREGNLVGLFVGLEQ